MQFAYPIVESAAGPEMETDERVKSTLTLADATNVPWDVLVIGAGPAGSIAAREAARLGARTLLVDRAAFPRRKVCGCCLSGAALALLDELGMRKLPAQRGALQLSRFQLACQGHLATISMWDGVSLSRERLDSALIDAAVDRGAAFLDKTQAMVGPSNVRHRQVALNRAGHSIEAVASVVVVAGGLACRVFPHQTTNDCQVAELSRIGAGTVLDASSDFDEGTVYMACHRSGYVGLVRLEDQRLDVAAALDSARVKEIGSVGQSVVEILATAGLPVPTGLVTANWQGTPKLTQQRKPLHRDRLFVVGDAACYVEPFTGEGIAGALATGRSVVPLVLESVTSGTELTGPAWTRKNHQLLGRRIRLCRTVSRLLRYPTAVSLAVHTLSYAPFLARPVLKTLNRPLVT